jgi:hypothetical protein
MVQMTSFPDDPRNAINYEDISDDDETGCPPSSIRESLSSVDGFETHQFSIPIQVITPLEGVIWASIPKHY